MPAGTSRSQRPNGGRFNGPALRSCSASSRTIRANLTLAYRLYDSFGAAPARRRAAAGLRSRNLTVPRRSAHQGAGLTDTEAQLVRLVYDGLSNQQIATAMHYSRKTIEVYLSRVYVKTGSASRLELIRAVERGDLDVEIPD